MSESKAQQKARDARRLAQQSVKGATWKNRPPGYDAERMRKVRELYGRAPRFMIEESFNPLTIKSNNICIACDWHIPFYDANLMSEMFKTCDEYGIKEIAIPGDFWDCDNFSRFTNLTQSGLSWSQTFRGETEEVATVLSALVERFKGVYFCRGNHEKRWMDQNLGKVNLADIFKLTGINNGYLTTNDDHIVLESGGEIWLLCHPRNFRQTPLSVGRDLCAKYRCNVFVAHGHAFAQGRDRSGRYQIVDGGGLFDAAALEYLRNTSTFPAVQGGYYLIQDGEAIPFRNERGANIDLKARLKRAVSL
jgi:hypothetical protein